ncbi:MAG: hypothetical protein PHO32_08650 [Candidatus Cloacimonetes bacterium]|nr:hypothetical protein [Candidatus Cloacimonadota bacterium]
MANVKYAVFFATLFVGVPLGYFLSLKYSLAERIVFFLMMFFTVRMEDINFVSREAYRLTSRGFEIGMVDIATIIILLLVIHRKKQYNVHIPPGSYFYFAYFAFSAISIINSSVVLFSMFELWKMVRMYIYFFVVYNYVNDFKKFNDFLKGVAAVTIYIFYEVIKQKYWEGKFQSPGPFPHQNSLVMYTIILGSLMFAYLINKKSIPPFKFTLWLLYFSMSAVIIVSSLSRAGIVLFGISIVIILGLSFFSGVTGKKVWVSMLIIFMSILVFAKAWDSISERFRTAPEASANVRKELAIASLRMAKDKSLGIGLNNFGIKINPPYPYSSHIEMNNPDDEDEQNGLVETIYLMIAAESGWHTLGIFFCFIFYFYFLNLRNYFRYRNTEFHFFSIGMIGGLLAIYLESTLEWVLKQTNNYYQLMLIFAMIAVMSKLENRYAKNKMQLPQNLSLKQQRRVDRQQRLAREASL